MAILIKEIQVKTTVERENSSSGGGVTQAQLETFKHHVLNEVRHTLTRQSRIGKER